MKVLVFDENTVSLSAQIRWGTVITVVHLAGGTLSQRL